MFQPLHSHLQAVQTCNSQNYHCKHFRGQNLSGISGRILFHGLEIPYKSETLPKKWQHTYKIAMSVAVLGLSIMCVHILREQYL